jgi:peroxiredoxin Q/BCP
MQIGETVEDFQLPDQTGQMRRLSWMLADGPVVLFFFPAALQPLCVAQACAFRDMSAEFASVGAQAVGISADPVPRQALFAEKHSLGYPLLSDVDGSVRERFHVDREYVPSFAPKMAKHRRNTFIIGTDGRVLDVIKSQIRVSVHAELALQFLRHRAGPTHY